MKNTSQLFIYPTTELSIANLDMTTDAWVQDPVAKYTWTYGKYTQVDNSGWASLTLPTTDLVNLKNYRVQYTLTGAKANCKHFISCKAAGTSKYNYGSGQFTVDVVAKNTGTPQFDNRIYFAILENGNAGATVSGFRIWEVNEYEIELYDTASIPINFSIASVQDISKRSTSYSKTIVLPGTQQNNIALQHSYRVSNDLSFKFNYPVRARLFNESLEIFSGDMYLQNITLQNEDNTIEYEADLRNSINTLFKVTAEKNLRGNLNKLDDLDFSEWDHTLNWININQSWYKGSILKPGYSNLPTASGWNDELGKGFVYPLINYGFGSTDIRVEDMRPALFIKEMWDKILSAAGYTYTSTFLNSDRFKRLIYPRHTKYEAGKEGVANRNYTVTNNTSLGEDGAFQVDHVNWNRPITSGQKEILNWTCPASGTYNFNVDVKKVIFARLCTNDSSLDIAWRDKSDNGTYSYLANMEFTLQKKVGTSWIGIGTPVIHMPQYFNNPQRTTNSYWSYWPCANPSLVISTSEKITAGQQIRLIAEFTSPHKDSNGSWNSRKNSIHGGDALYTIRGCVAKNGIQMVITGEPSSALAEGDNVSMNFNLPEGIKQSDFLQSIVKMFNLYIDLDITNPLNLIIEPRDVFYSGGTSYDWSQKRDFDAEFKIEQASDINNKNILFTWTPDEDIYNLDYQQYGRTYGQDLISADIYTKDQTTIQPIFAPTVMDTFGSWVNKKAIVVPEMFKTEGGKDSFKPRILYWGGLQYWDTGSTGAYYGYNANWKLSSLADGSKYFRFNSGINNSAFYPFAGHCELAPIKGQTPTFDLNFGNNWWYYWGPDGGTYTYNNLVSTYYSIMLQELADKDSKMITTWVYLNDEDIHNMSFKNYYIIDGVYYRLYQIIDYVPNITTKVVLLKLKAGSIPIATSKWNKWEYELIDNWQPKDNSIAMLKSKNGAPNFIGTNIIHNYDAPYNSMFGDYNEIQLDSRNNIINGNYNYIGSECYNNTIQGSDNVKILNKVSNVSVMNTPGITVTESNTSYINGQKFKDGILITRIDIINGGIDEIQNPFSSAIQNVICGGIDENRKLGSFSITNVVNG